jgi:hypothetical protein
MIGAAVLIAIGIIAGQFFPNQFREWVRARQSGGARKISGGIEQGAPVAQATSAPERPTAASAVVEAHKLGAAGK